jgi:hypothetical protein
MKKPLLVTKVADEYSIDELMQFREQFAPIAQRCRKLKRRNRICFFAGIIWMAIPLTKLSVFSDILPKSLQTSLQNLMVGWPLGVLLWFLLTIVFWVQLLRFECPACHNRLASRRLGSYCPECGSDQLEAGNWYRAWRCNACGKRLAHDKEGPCYKIRYCTHCGVFLDEKGLSILLRSF